MRVAIVGCGLHSRYHLKFANEYRRATVVGVVDKDRSRARTCAELHGVPGFFPGIPELVREAAPDVVHIVSPPQSHARLAQEALRAHCHVLIEAPLAVSLKEATELYDQAAEERGALCTMHNHRYDPCMVQADELVRAGSLGQIVNVESWYGVNTRAPVFRDYPAPNVLPWPYKLPGGVFHDSLPHPLSVMLDYTGRPRELKVMKKSHGVLPWNLPDEVRILIEGERAFGTLVLSAASMPHLHFLRLYGTEMSADVDFNTMTVVTHPPSPLPGPVGKAMYNLSDAVQRLGGTMTNAGRYLRGRLKPYQGMKELIHRFYDSLYHNADIPVSREQALLVTGTMDEIWRQLRPQRLRFDPVAPPAPRQPQQKRVLITGGTGFIGTRTAAALLQAGYRVRVLARKLSRIEAIAKQPVEIHFGDVADKQSLAHAFAGADIVVHAAAGTSGRKTDCDQATVQGTRNVLELCERTKTEKLIYISSGSVYGLSDCKAGQRVTENSALERFPHLRGDLAASKQTAEDLVRWAMEQNKVPIVILRPGMIYGPGPGLYSPRLGFSLLGKLFFVFGSGSDLLPAVYVENMAQAVVQAVRCEKANNQVFNVADADRITARRYMQQIIKNVNPRALVLFCPLTLLYGAVGLQEMLFRAFGRPPLATRYRLLSSYRSVDYDGSKIRETLRWSPGAGFAEAAAEIVRAERPHGKRAAIRDPDRPGVQISGAG